MLPKDILFSTDARGRILKGIDTTARAVRATLGPKGRLIAIEKKNSEPVVTKDGVTVAKELVPSDRYERMGSDLIKQAARKTNEEAGDGPQPLHAKIMNPYGFTRMGDIEVGDIICGTDGTTQTVEGVYEKGNRETLEVEFCDGRVVECCEDHLWSVTTSRGVRKTINTRYMATDFKKLNMDGSHKYRYFVEPTITMFAPQNVPIDPYLLGVLVGDGSLSGTGCIELSLGLDKEHIIHKLNVPEGTRIDVKLVARKSYYRVKLYGTRLKEGLETLGLFGTKSHTKFIPREYLVNTEEVRNELLQGLLDTDGHINARGLFEYSTVSEQLAEDFMHLIRSLGMSATKYLHERTPGQSYSMRSIYRITQRRGYKHGLKVKDIRRTGRVSPMRCIKVSNDDSLYITDDFVPTHNTTTSTVLAHALIQKGIELVERGTDAQTLKTELDEAVHEAVEALKSLSEPVSDQIGYIARISANDERIGKVITEAIESVGQHGSIEIKDGVKPEDELIIADGMKLPRGPVHPLFSNTRHHDAYRVEHEDALVLVTDEELKDITQLAGLVDKVGTKPLLIFAPKVSDEVIAVILYNNKERGLNILPIPFTTFQWQGQLRDVAAYTGATLVSGGTKNLADAVDLLGSVESVMSNKNETVLRGGGGDVEERKEEIKSLLEGDVSLFQRELYEKRIANLDGKVALIQVAGATESEKIERRHRYEDAANSVRSALEEGIVPGGGWALVQAAKGIKAETDGAKLLKWAMTQPMYWIAHNAGQSGDVVLSLITDKVGYNARTHTFEDLKKAGVIDPVKVPRLALINAASIAGVTFTLEGVMVYADEE